MDYQSAAKPKALIPDPKCKKWLHSCSLTTLLSTPSEEIYKKYYRLCSRHFQAKDYASPNMCRLTPSACPSNFGSFDGNVTENSISVLSLQQGLQAKLGSNNEGSVSSPILVSTPTRKKDSYKGKVKRLHLEDVAEIQDVCDLNSAGYVVKQVMKKFKCVQCQSAVTQEKQLSDSSIFLSLRNMTMKTGLQYASESLTNTVCKFGRVFSKTFSVICHEKDIKTKIIAKLINFDNSWLTCYDHAEKVWTFVLDLYVRMMLFNQVKRISKEKRNSKKSKKN